MQITSALVSSGFIG